jgi:D-alanine-D-alanine ligase
MAIDMRPNPIAPALFGKVAVLMGGWSAERTVSLNSGQAVLDALLRQGVNAHGIDVHRPQVISDLQQGGFDRAFNILHGPGGEDGVIQGLLEVLGLPYTGSGVMASALAMDKLRSKQLLVGAGIPTPPWMILEADTEPGLVEATLGLPVMVKPALEGSSIGMSKVVEAEALTAAYHEAAAFQGEVLAERWIEGGEYTVAILGDDPLPVICLETPREFYDYEAKYQASDTRYLCPCGLPTEEEHQLQRLALAAFRATGAKGWGRVDILCDTDGTPYVIELNTVPGMTDHSLVPMAAGAAGIEFDELVVRILAQTLTISQEGNDVRAG